MPDYTVIDLTKLMHCGVYALLRKGEVVYVGKSKQPLMRLHTHMLNRKQVMGKVFSGSYSGPMEANKGINFDGIWFLPCMLGQLSILEAHLIREHRPKYNVQHNPDLKPRPVREPTVIMPIPEDIKELLRQMVVITGLPPLEDRPKVYIRRLL